MVLLRFRQRSAQRGALRLPRSPWGTTVAGHVEFGERGFVIVGTPTDPPGEFPLDHAPQVMVFRRISGGWRLSSSILPGYTTVFGPVRVQDASGEWVNLT